MHRLLVLFLSLFYYFGLTVGFLLRPIVIGFIRGYLYYELKSQNEILHNDGEEPDDMSGE